MTTSRAVPSGIWLVAAAAVLWALIGLFTPALLDEGLRAVDIAFWRALVGGGCFVLHGFLRAKLGVQSRRDAGELLLFGVVAVGIFYAALALAVDLGGVSLAWILLYTAPAWVAIAAATLLGEHVDRRRWTLVGATIAGVVLVSVGGGEGVRVSAGSVFWGLVAGLSYASWYVGGKRFLPRYDPVTISAWILLAGAAVLAPFAQFAFWSTRAWLLVVGLSFVSTYLPALLYYSGLGRVDASRAAIVATVEPVAALAIAALVDGERLTPLGAVGAFVVLGAAAVAALRPTAAPRRTAEAATARRS